MITFIDFFKNFSFVLPIFASNFNFSLVSPIKDYGIHVSDQLNTLRTLLETRLKEQDDGHYQPKDSSILQSSPGTFTKDFLQSYQQSKGQTSHSAREVISDVDNDTEVNEDKQTVKYYEANQSDVLSTSAASSHSPHLSPIGELNQSRLRSSATISSTTTITPNSIEKNYTREYPLIVDLKIVSIFR